MMKTGFFALLLTIFLVVGISPGRPEAQTATDYTFVTGSTGQLVCIGTWVPPKDVALPGVCEGQVVDVTQFTAISSRLTADRLDQLIVALGAIDQKLALSNEQLNRLIDVTAGTQMALDRQTGQSADTLREAVAERFETLPQELLANAAFREALTNLKEDILKEVEKLYQKRPPK
jgi:hypothetical protein